MSLPLYSLYLNIQWYKYKKNTFSVGIVRSVSFYLFVNSILILFLVKGDLFRDAVRSNSEEDRSLLIHVFSLDKDLVNTGTESHPMRSVPHFLKVLIEQYGSTAINQKLDGQFCIGVGVKLISEPPPAHLGHRNEGICVALRFETEFESYLFVHFGQN